MLGNMNFNNLFSFSLLDILFVIDLFKFKHINRGLILLCKEHEEPINLQKFFNRHGIILEMVYIQNNVKIPNSYMKTGIIVNSSCDGWTNLFKSHSIPFAQTNSWIIITGNLSNTANSLAPYPVEINSDVTVAYKTGNIFDLSEMYNTGTLHKGTFVVRDIGRWNRSLNIVPKDRINLRGAVIKISVVSLRSDNIEDQTIEHYMDRGIFKVDSVNRFKFFILLKYLRDMCNISYNVQRVESWGYFHNGSFDGMVGALSRGEAEIGGSPVFTRADRAQHVQYISEVWHSRNCFIFRHPKHSDGFYNIYTRPLSDLVWFCSLCLLIVAAFVLWVTMRTTGADDPSPSLAVLTIWGAFCQQASIWCSSICSGSSIVHYTSPVKIVLFTTFVCSLTVYQYYNATIVSSLLQEPPKNIRTLKDLLHSNLKVGVHDVAYDRDYFKHTKDPVAIELYKKKIATPTNYNFFTSDVGMALVKKGGFAFHLETTIAFSVIKETFSEQEICETGTVQLYPLQKTAVVMKRFSPYKEHVAYCIRRMYEAGLLGRLQSVLDAPMSECVHTPDVNLFRVNLREFSMPLTALALGALAATLVFTCELLAAQIMNKLNYRVHTRKC